MPPSSYSETTTLIKRPSTSSATTASELNEGKNVSNAGYISNEQVKDIHVKINGKWLALSKEFVTKHPGGSVINQYK